MTILLDDCVIAIFGATGDLTQRKLLPSLFGLFANGLTPRNFKIMALGRSPIPDADFKATCHASITKVRNNFLKDEMQAPQVADQLVNDFVERIFYVKANALTPEDYQNLADTLADTAAQLGAKQNYVFYLSTPPSAYTTIAKHLSSVGLADETKGWRRLIIEKPFGYDVETAKQLNDDLHQYFNESQLYRIDHYLGKETVQNLLVFRFANALFEPIWNYKYVDYVEFTVSEQLGVEGRAAYYDHSGALRDMFQNHLLNVLSFLTMEAPARFEADAIRDEQYKVIRALRPITQETLPNQVLLAQYTAAPGAPAGTSNDYLKEPGVDPNSHTETYIQAKIEIDNWRWAGVPFYVRTGKKLKERLAEIVIHFKQSPHADFRNKAPANNLVIRIQPDESVKMNFGMKKPGSGFDFFVAEMDFEYKDLTRREKELLILDAYQRLLLDAIRGDATLFTRSDFVNACWNYVQPIIDHKATQKIHNYVAGSWGPANDLLHRDGLRWYRDEEATEESCQLPQF